MSVGDGDTITCTITNTRKTGTIIVNKALVPATDAGTFDLQVDGANVATQVGDGGTGSKVVNTGVHTVGETGENLADYAAYTSCTDAAGADVAKGSGVLNVTVGNGDTITCTITNTRKTGTIVVKKLLLPATDTGTFDLQVDGTDVATQVGDGGTGSKVVNTGTHTVGEAGANLGDYTSSTSCLDAASTEVANGSGVLTIAVGDGDTITCTITNTRKVTPTPPSQPPARPRPRPRPDPAARSGAGRGRCQGGQPSGERHRRVPGPAGLPAHHVGLGQRARPSDPSRDVLRPRPQGQDGHEGAERPLDADDADLRAPSRRQRRDCPRRVREGEPDEDPHPADHHHPVRRPGRPAAVHRLIGA